MIQWRESHGDAIQSNPSYASRQEVASVQLRSVYQLFLQRTWLTYCLSWTILMIEMSLNRSNAHRVSVSGILLGCCKRSQLTEDKSYRFSQIAKSLRAVQSSTKTSLRIDNDGLLSLQFMMPAPKAKDGGAENSSAFIDFQVRSYLDSWVELHFWTSL